MIKVVVLALFGILFSTHLAAAQAFKEILIGSSNIS